MGNLNIHFQGLGLWLDTTNPWRVLLPKAELFKNNYDEDIERHDPRLIMGEPGREPQSYRDIADCEVIIDPSAVHEVIGASVRHENLLGIRVHPGSAAAHPTPLHHPDPKISERVLAQLTLPPGYISAPQDTLFKTCEFNGATDLTLTFRPRWSAPLVGDEVRVEIRPRGDGPSRFFTCTPDVTGNITLLVQHLSRTDREQPDASRTEDKDFVANYGLARPVGMKGPTPHPRCGPRTIEGWASEYHPCDPAFGCEDASCP